MVAANVSNVWLETVTRFMSCVFQYVVFGEICVAAPDLFIDYEKVKACKVKEYLKPGMIINTLQVS